VGKNLGFRAGW